MFGKAIPVIGWIITGIQFVWNLFKRLRDIINDPNMSIGQKIVAGLKAIPGAIYDTLIKPFVDAFNWIVNKLGFGANSPSKLGLSIVQGILGVEAMIFDAITSPFRHAFAWILDKIPGMSKFATKIKGGASGLLNKSVETKAIASYTPAVQVNPNETKIVGRPDNLIQTKETNKEQSSTKYSLDDIYNMLKQLNDNLLSGKIKSGDIHMDGQLLSATLARQTSFRGGFGVNNIS